MILAGYEFSEPSYDGIGGEVNVGSSSGMDVTKANLATIRMLVDGGAVIVPVTAYDPPRLSVQVLGYEMRLPVPPVTVGQTHLVGITDNEFMCLRGYRRPVPGFTAFAEVHVRAGQASVLDSDITPVTRRDDPDVADRAWRVRY